MADTCLVDACVADACVVDACVVDACLVDAKERIRLRRRTTILYLFFYFSSSFFSDISFVVVWGMDKKKASGWDIELDNNSYIVFMRNFLNDIFL